MADPADGTRHFDVEALLRRVATGTDAAEVVVVHGRNRGKHIELCGALTRIGRRADNDLVLDSDTVSRAHACIERRQERYRVTDVGARNGVFVNGRRIPPDHPRELAHGDSLALGDELLVFRRPAHAFSHPEPPRIALDRARAAAEADELLQRLLGDAPGDDSSTP